MEDNSPQEEKNRDAENVSAVQKPAEKKSRPEQIELVQQSADNTQNVEALKEIADLLRQTREKFNLSILQVSRELKIRQRYIEDIEAGDFAAIPGGSIYISGFLRGYASYLQLDAQELLAKYKAAAGNQTKKQEFHFPESYYDQSRPTRIIIAASLVFAVIVYGVWYDGKSVGDFFGKQAETISAQYSKVFDGEEAVAQAPQSPQDRAVPESFEGAKEFAEEEVVRKVLEVNEADAPKEQAANDKPKAKKNARIVLLAKEDTWVKISDTDKSFLLERVMQSGDTYFLPEKKNLVITAGNAEAIEVFIDGEKNSFLGTLKDIARN